jgi:hypothetical protein
MNVKKVILYLVIAIAAFLTLIPYLIDGQRGCFNEKCGFIFGTNYRDGMWFLAISNVSFQKFPFLHPTFAGGILKGYHFLPNFFIYLLSKIGISPFFSYFKIIPLTYFLLITLLLIKVFKKIKNDFSLINIGLFFFYFGIPLTLLTSLINRQPLNNGLLINTFQATRVLESPHTAIGLILIFVVFLWLLENKLEKRWSVFLLIYFLSFGVKFYVATTLGLIIFFNILFSYRFNLKQVLKKMLILGVVSAFGIIIFLQPDFSKTPTFNFAPFATVHHLVESDNLFYNKNLILARYFLYEHGFGPRLLFIEIYSLILFVVFYLGTRFFGLIYLTNKILKKKGPPLELSVFLTSVFSLFLATFFVQRGDWFNPIQFFVPVSYLLSIYTALFFYQLFKKSKIAFLIIFSLVFVFTFIPNLINLNYSQNPARFVISKKEIEGLNFLKQQSFGYVFAPIDENDTPYVAVFSHKPTYLNFVTINQTLGVDYQERLTNIEKPENFDPNIIQTTYFYLPKKISYVRQIISKFKQRKYKRIFENEEVILYNRSYEQ